MESELSEVDNIDSLKSAPFSRRPKRPIDKQELEDSREGKRFKSGTYKGS